MPPKLSIEEMQELASLRSGSCISKYYINTLTKLTWKCAKGHVWDAVPKNIKHRSWCPNCAGTKLLTIKDMRNLAKSRGWKLISEEYKGNKCKLEWQCKEGHNFYMRSNNVQQGQHCPICNGSISEEKCRYIFNYLLDAVFQKTKKILPDNLELDGYCKELKVAFEYQGDQHYREIFYFQKNKSLYTIKNTDERKVSICKDLGITLIVIPYYENKGDKELLEYIANQLKLQGYNIESKLNDFSFDNFYTQSSKLDELDAILKKREGKCLSPCYRGSKEKLKLECKRGHVFQLTPNQIKLGVWCRKCWRKVEEVQEEMHRIAKEKGGRCITQKYIDCVTKMDWECIQGHTWKATLSSVRKSWCPECDNFTRYSIDDMIDFAKKRKGECLSTTYTNKAKLRWRCFKGHEWGATAKSIRHGSWCPHCNGNAKLSINKMHSLARKKEGFCLSQEYINSALKILWRCKSGHTFESTPNNVRAGRWCPECAREKMVKYTIGDMKALAESKGGLCISEEYVTNKSHTLKWQCKKGHNFEIPPIKVRAGKWCSICAKEKGET
ncbi:hypothetical protein [Desulfosporosinus sp. HMP52]|uniref:hypothetical protein n=1 Tax=Desulfosporosinus sp. HMP52 TaxID=1487923 RepID=UPI000691FB70|nr:hypothetical protein [Desulfosporosinus sp. HMP52]